MARMISRLAIGFVFLFAFTALPSGCCGKKCGAQTTKCCGKCGDKKAEQSKCSKKCTKKCTKSSAPK